MRHNSTIIPKRKNLKCGHFDYAFSKGRCKTCASIEDGLKRIAKHEEKEDETLSELIKEADAIFSKYIRLKYSDGKGNVECYTCGKKMKIGEAQCGHYISRNNKYLRFDSRNARVQCEECNEFKHGNLLVFAQKLEAEKNGITEVLYEESAVVYKYSRDELRQLINEFKFKIKQLK